MKPNRMYLDSGPARNEYDTGLGATEPPNETKPQTLLPQPEGKASIQSQTRATSSMPNADSMVTLTRGLHTSISTQTTTLTLAQTLTQKHMRHWQ